MLIVTLLRILPQRNDVLRSLENILYTTSALCAARFGATEREAELISLPFGWLTGNTVLVVLHRVGLADLQSRLGLSDQTGKWCSRATFGMFLVVQVWLYGFGTQSVTVLALWHGIRLVYTRLG